MKTVKDYLDLGLVFVDGDKLLSAKNNKDNKEVCMSGLCIAHKRYCDGFRGGNAIFFYPSEWMPSSFAWRNNDGVKPEYNGLIDVCFEGGTVSHDESAIDFEWSLGDENYIAKWRPVVLQSEAPTVSPKEDKPMKPVYTAEMHAKGELPQVDSECEALCMDATNSKHAWTKAKILMHHEGNECAVYCIDAGVLRWADEFRPITKTIKVNGFDIHAPMSEAPEHRQMVYLASSAHIDFNLDFTWQDDEAAVRWLSRGLIHLTKSAAIAHAKAMLGINPNPAKGAK